MGVGGGGGGEGSSRVVGKRVGGVGGGGGGCWQMWRWMRCRRRADGQNQTGVTRDRGDRRRGGGSGR